MDFVTSLTHPRGTDLEVYVAFGALIVATQLIALVAASWWRVFERAGRSGWASLIPGYRRIVLSELAGLSSRRWKVVACIPGLSLVWSWRVSRALAQQAGRSEWFALGIMLVPFAALPRLAGPLESTPKPVPAWRLELTGQLHPDLS